MVGERLPLPQLTLRGRYRSDKLRLHPNLSGADVHAAVPHHSHTLPSVLSPPLFRGETPDLIEVKVESHENLLAFLGTVGLS